MRLIPYLFSLLIFTHSLKVWSKDPSLKDLPSSPMLLEDASFDFTKIPSHKMVIIDLWASWCGPCEESLPKLHRIQQENPHVQVILLNEDDSKKEGTVFLNKYPQLKKLTLLFDQRQALAKILKVEAIPSTFIFNQEGQLIKRLRGYKSTTEGDIRKAIKLPPQPADL